MDLIPDRLAVHIAVSEDCWLWTGAVASGYGYARWDGVVQPAHRIVYSLLVGPIPEGLDLDHRCRVTLCVNPAHLEPVTRRENVRRGAGNGGALWVQPTVCRNGHDQTSPGARDKPTRSHPNGRCAECRRARQRGLAA